MKCRTIAVLAIAGTTVAACGYDRQWSSGKIELSCGPFAWTPDASAVGFHDHDRRELVRISRGKRVEVSDTACATGAASVVAISPDGRHAVAWGDESTGGWHSGRHTVASCVVAFGPREARPLGAAAESVLADARDARDLARLSSTGMVVAPAWQGIVFAHMDGGSATWVTLPPAGDPELFVDPIQPWVRCIHVSAVGNEVIAVCAVDKDNPDLIGVARVQFSPPSVLQARVVHVPVPVGLTTMSRVAVSRDGAKVVVLTGGDSPTTLLRIVVDTGAIELVQPLEIEGDAWDVAVAPSDAALIGSKNVGADEPVHFTHLAADGRLVGRSRAAESVGKLAWDGGKSFWISGCDARRMPVP